jgi:subfamily B ATP-binding cassette protein MsbA
VSLPARTLWRLLALGRPHRGLLVRAFAAMVVLGLTTGLFAWLMGPALRFLLSGGQQGLGQVAQLFPFLAQVDPAAAQWAFPALIVVIALVKGAAYLGQFYWMGLYGQKVAADLRRSLLARFLRLSPTDRSARQSGDLLSRFTSDVTTVETAATYAVASYLRDTVQVIVLAAVALALDWRVALAAFVVIPLAALPVSRLTRSFLRRAREGQAGLGALAAQVGEGLSGMRTVQAFNAESAERARFAERARGHRRALTRAAWLRGAVPGVMEILAAGALALILAWAAQAQAVPPDRLVSLLAAIILVYQPVKDLGRVTQFAVEAAAAGERLYAVLDLPDADEARGGQRLSPVREAVRLEDIHFAFGDRPALEGLTLDIPAGKTTALVGPSGAGKSTVVSLLLGFERPKAGRLLFDGADAQQAEASEVRRQFALVTQEPLLFSGTVEENLRFARPEATLAEVVAAAKVARADGFIRALPEGYQTPVGERGARLSGGQRQRLCLARAVLAAAPVLLLDEATSNLDPQSEAEVQAALEGVLEGRTALVIAHRLATVVSADRIHVVDAGRVVESGTHEDLTARGGLYARLWALQNTGAPLEAVA